MNLLSKFTKTSLYLLIIVSSGCSYKYFYPTNFDLEINSVTAVDLEEDGYWLSSGQDEIELYYTLASLDMNNGLYGTPKRRHYGPHEFTYRGETKYGYSPLSVKVPAKGKIYFSIHLTENDDYSSILQTIDDAKTIVDIAKFISRNKKKGRLAARTFKLASRTLKWLGIAITIVDILDTNDRLMGFCVVLDEEQLRIISEKSKISGTIRGAGSNWGDKFDYRVNFSLLAEKAFGESIKERIKSKAPNFYVAISPFMIDQNLNDYWSKSQDRLLVESSKNKDELEFSDGLYNKNLSAFFGFAISPAFKMGKSSHGKFYLQGGYRRLPYFLNFEHDYKISNQYFQNTSGTSPNLTVQNVEFDISQYSGSTLFKVLSKKIVWDIGGGVLYHEGKMNFEGLEIRNPNTKFTYNENSNILEKSFLPFAFTKLGYGKISKSTGYMIYFGLMAFKPEFKPNDQFGIYTNFGNTNLQLTSISSNELRFSYSFGLGLYF